MVPSVSVIPARPESFFEEGFPSSGNDKLEEEFLTRVKMMVRIMLPNNF